MKAALEQFESSPPRLSFPLPPLEDASASMRSTSSLLSTSSSSNLTMSSSAPKYSITSEHPKQQRPTDYDVIKMKYLRSLNITANGPMAIPSKKEKDESIASSAPIPIPIASHFARNDSEDEESSDTETSNSNSEFELSPALIEPKKPNKSKKFVPPHELNHTTSGSSLVNHSLPNNYREKYKNRGI